MAFIAYFQAYECDAALMYVHVPSSYQPRFPKVSLITNYEINLIPKSTLVKHMTSYNLIPRELKAPELIDVRRHP